MSRCKESLGLCIVKEIRGACIRGGMLGEGQISR